MNIHDVIRRPIVTEKGVEKKDNQRTLCFEVAVDANKTEIRHAVAALFKVKVDGVRTVNVEGKLRRRGRFSAAAIERDLWSARSNSRTTFNSPSRNLAVRAERRAPNIILRGRL